MDSNLVCADTYWVGTIDRQSALFEAIWPIPSGMTFNSYLITDEKTALIDGVKEGGVANYLEKIDCLLPKDRVVDYLIVNHMEPDHSGALPILCNRYPNMKIIGNKRTVGFLEGFYGLGDRCQEISDGESLSLGEHELSFHITPMVHWPETMVSYDRFTKTVFSGDVFGGFGSLGGNLFDDETDMNAYEPELLRYYVNIIAKYSKMVGRALAKLEPLDIDVIAPTHGVIFRRDPNSVMQLYHQWSEQQVTPGVVIAYASMYGNTKKLAEATARALNAQGLKDVRVFNVSVTHPSYILAEAWTRGALVLASCSYNSGIFPLMSNFLNLLKEKQYLNRFLGIIGTYSWSGGARAALEKFVQEGAWKLVEPIIEVKCGPRAESFEQCEQLSKAIIESLKGKS